jgi:glycogen debranching enzyme
VRVRDEECSSEQGLIQVLSGSTFMLSDSRGDVIEGSTGGLFHEDTRYLSCFVLRINGRRPSVLSSGNAEYYSAAFFLTNPELRQLPAQTLSIQRFRFIGDGLSEILVVQSHLDYAVPLELRISCGVDFADLFEVKRDRFVKRGQFTRAHRPNEFLLFEYRHDDFLAATRLHCSEPFGVAGDELVLRTKLDPAGTWKARLQVEVQRGHRVFSPIAREDREASMALQQWREGGQLLEAWRNQLPTLEADWQALKMTYEQSIADLAALRLHADVEGNEYALPAAGLPWFMAIFGRDTLITSYQSLLISPDLARGALFALSALQGTEVNDFKDEEPGKILHEVRFGELTILGEMPHRPYFGSVDATPLFLILLSEYWRLTRDDRTVEELREHALAALSWIDHYGDLDQDGFVEYRTRSPRGLRNQGWKDSWNGVLFSDGHLAEPPIALCEVQGYVYDAKLRTAELADAVWGDDVLGKRLRDEARGLFDRFNEDYWIEERGGYYAEALDRDHRRVDSVTSNMGHLLWSGIVPEERAAAVVDQLFSLRMFSGWGLRTLSSEDAGYNPISYHNGTVWPHDNSLIAAGLTRYGFRDRAFQIASSMIEAASHTGFRLPEVFAGYPRSESIFPVRYPTASSPQAWATAAPFLWLRALLGIDSVEEAIHVDPYLPPRIGAIAVHGLQAMGTQFDVIAREDAAEIIWHQG